jgi:hypothetical protein
METGVEVGHQQIHALVEHRGVFGSERVRVADPLQYGGSIAQHGYCAVQVMALVQFFRRSAEAAHRHFDDVAVELKEFKDGGNVLIENGGCVMPSPISLAFHKSPRIVPRKTQTDSDHDTTGSAD